VDALERELRKHRIDPPPAKYLAPFNKEVDGTNFQERT